MSIQTDYWKQRYWLTNRDAPTSCNDLLLKKISEIGNNKTILDVGCGTGRYSQMFGKMCKKLYGIDFMEYNIENAKKIKPENCEVYLDDVTDLKFNKNVDIIFTQLVLQHVHPIQIDKAVENLCKLNAEDIVLCESSSSYENENNNNHMDKSLYFWSHDYKSIMFECGYKEIEKKLFEPISDPDISTYCYHFKKIRIDFTKPYINEKIIKSVCETLESGWITTGPKVVELQNIICNKFNIEHVLCLNSWTNAAEIILRWFGITDGDEIIIPVSTYCATGNIGLHCGAKIIMVDIGDDLNINVDKIKDKITNKTKIIIPVDIAGISCKYDKIIDIINNADIKKLFTPTNDIQNKLGRILLLSDAAHSIGTEYNNKFACNYADFTVYSFHAVKNITTAEGGAICFNLPSQFNNLEVYNYFKMFTLHGQTKTAMDKYASTASKYNYWEYDIIMPGYKCNMPDILAAVGLEQMKVFDNLTLIRKNVCREYIRILKHCEHIHFYTNTEDIDNSSCHLFCIRINDFTHEERNMLMNELVDKNIKMNIHFKPLPLLTAYSNLKYDMSNFPNAMNIYSNIISLPLHYNLDNTDILYISKCIIESIHSIKHTNKIS